MMNKFCNLGVSGCLMQVGVVLTKERTKISLRKHFKSAENSPITIHMTDCQTLEKPSPELSKHGQSLGLLFKLSLTYHQKCDGFGDKLSHFGRQTPFGTFSITFYYTIRLMRNLMYQKEDSKNFCLVDLEIQNSLDFRSYTHLKLILVKTFTKTRSAKKLPT